MIKHVPVMAEECIAFLNASKGKTIVDCTLGLGGHTKELLNIGCNVISIDRDEKAIEFAKKELPKEAVLINSEFSKLREILDDLSISKVVGILADLGVSTYQLEDDERGFGFKGKLDMRMNPKQKVSAFEIINEDPEEKISNLLFEYGERRFANAVARSICRARTEKSIETGEELLEIVKRAMPPKYRFSREHHWATPTFRALRMEVNNDLGELKSLISTVPDCLKNKGRLAIISFHSMEDKIVKHMFRDYVKKGIAKVLTKKPILASKEEISLNPKAQRAKLRAIEIL